MRKKTVTGKTVQKLYRLARELEVANGVRVCFGMFRLFGRQYFYFEPVRNNRPGDVLWDGCGGPTIGEALADFYLHFTYTVLYNGIQYYRPARPDLNVRPTLSRLHGKRIVI